MAVGEWIDLVDPDEAELRERIPAGHSTPRALDRLSQPAEHDGRAAADDRAPRRLRLRRLPRRGRRPGGGPRLLPGDRHRPDARARRHRPQDAPGGQPYDTTAVHEACERGGASRPGMVALPPRRRHRRALPRPDRHLNDEIDELEDHVEDWPARRSASGSPSCATTCSTSAGRSRPPATRPRASSTAGSSIEGGELFPPRRRAPFRRRLRQAPARERRPRALARPRRRRPRLPRRRSRTTRTRS